MNKIYHDFNTNQYKKESKYEFGFSIDTIKNAFNAVESYHIAVHQDLPSFHIWKKHLEQVNN
ncbi:MAG: hypothetical protein CVT99_02185 [Bacteroidetes bacterium HGW-Bacteroidetes-16]|nr:MAG: hypothetical protein CVT99_02185 [Bacteroidetes bacterium HGW-Bacteroidetes-16]